MQTNDTGENYGPLTTGVCSQVSGQAVRSDTDFVPNQLDVKENLCSTTQTYSNNTGSPPAQWHDITLNDNGRSDASDASDSGGCPDTYENMITRMGEIEKTLAAIKDTVTTASVRCHLLNVDVVTMFSPEMVDTLSNTVEQCENCIKTMETSSPEDS